jgi:hypothetical protein
MENTIPEFDHIICNAIQRENRKGWVGLHIKGVVGELYHDDQGDKVNPMG